jgi:hypothetical protein
MKKKKPKKENKNINKNKIWFFISYLIARSDIEIS